MALMWRLLLTSVTRYLLRYRWVSLLNNVALAKRRTRLPFLIFGLRFLALYMCATLWWLFWKCRVLRLRYVLNVNRVLVRISKEFPTFRRTRSTSVSPTSVTTAVGSTHVVSYGSCVPKDTLDTGG